MMDNEITIIEITADAIYLVIVGDKKSIDDIIVALNNTAKCVTYVMTRLDTPIAIKCNELAESLQKEIQLDIGIETAQCYTYAEGYDNKNYMVLSLETLPDKIILSYPKITLSDDGDAEKTIFDWTKKRLGKVPKSIKKSLRPITLVGDQDEILVFSTKYKCT